MLTPEHNLTERSLQANFTEVQQAHFDKLMSELEVISGGLGFAELKAKAEEGDKEALQVMRDYITKKEQIVEFIEKKEVPENEWREEELKVGDEVFVLNTAHFGEKVKILDINDLGKVKRYYVKVKEGANTNLRFFQDWYLAKNKPEEFDADRAGKIYLLDLKKYNGLTVGDFFSKGVENREILGFKMPEHPHHRVGLTIVVKKDGEATFLMSYKRFIELNEEQNYKKVEKS